MFDNKKLMKARKDKGFSVDDLVFYLASKGFRITGQSVYNWEHGKFTPNANDLAVLASVLGKPIEYFFKNES